MEIKRKQDFVIAILGSRKILFEEIDISDPAREFDKKFMREHSHTDKSEPLPLPPQIFNDDIYCGDYDGLFTANENVMLFEFLKLENEALSEQQRNGEDKHNEVEAT